MKAKLILGYKLLFLEHSPVTIGSRGTIIRTVHLILKAFLCPTVIYFTMGEVIMSFRVLEMTLQYPLLVSYYG
jgi:hypothetical protein